MKNRMKHFIFVLLLVVGFSANATDGLAVKVDKNQTLVIEVSENLQNGFLTLKDESGELLFKDCLITQEAPYKEELYLGNLPEGVYYLAFENEHSIFTEVITKRLLDIVIEEERDEVLFKPLFTIDGKKVKFKLSNPAKKETEVKVFDSSGELVGSVKSKDPLIGKTFDFSRVPSGNYDVAVNIGQHTFTKKLNL